MRLKGRSGGMEAGGFRTRFASKLYLAFGLMLLVTLALAWYFYDSVQWYEHDVQQIAGANHVLQEYQSLAEQTWQLLSGMGEAVAAGRADADPTFQAGPQAIRETIERLRDELGAGGGLEEGIAATDGLARLADLERVVAQILEAHAAIALALQNGEPDAAAAALRSLHAGGLVSLFGQLADSVIADQRAAVRRSQSGAIELAGYITGLLPVLMLGLILITLAMVWLFARSLTRSVNALQEGAMAFSAGRLDYRIPALREAEFKRLGEEFNTMAHELAEHRARLDEAKVRLEAVVEERTRALMASNERLAATDDNRRQLIADISHEFRTPLTVIQGEAEIALRGGGKSAEDYRDSLLRILDQSRQTTRLVDDLLFIARAEVGEPRLDLGETGVAGVLDTVCRDFAARAEARGIDIRRRLTDARPTLIADAGRLRQVFSILVDNAIKYSGKGGQVDVALENGADSVTVTVSDRGIGLTEEELKHVFMRFYRSKRAQGQETGTGLGLPVAKAIVEAHGGEIALEARPGGGITSTVRLPLRRDTNGPA